MTASKLTDKEMNDLKSQVLIDRLDYLCEELGDPARYHAALRSKGVISSDDIERVKAKVTARDKVQELIELIHKRRSDKDVHAMDVLMEALKKQRVQAHIARELQRALARAKEKRGPKEQDDSPVTQPPRTLAAYASSPAVPRAKSPLLSSLSTSSSTPTPSTSTAQVEEYEIHPRFGALPNLPHDRVVKPEKHQSPMTQPTTEVHPRFGSLPGPPPPKHGTVQSVQSVADANSVGGGEVAVGLSGLQYSTQDSFSMGPTTTATYSTQTFNGDGQYHSLVEADGHFSDMSDRQSCTTASGTVYSGSSAGSGREYAGDYGRRSDAALTLETKLEMDNALQRRTLDVSRLKEKNNQLKQQLRETTDKYEELQKQHVQMREQLRQKTLADQKHMFDSYKKENTSSTALEERVLSLEKENKALKGYLEQYQRENQQLQLLSVSSTSSSRPHHLPIGGSRVPHSGPPTYSYTPSTPHGPVRDTPAPLITPFKSQRLGDHLSQHNIHIQHPRHSPHKQSPLFTPSKDAATIGKRLSSSSGETPIGEGYLQSSSSSLNSMQSNGSKGSSGVTLQPMGSEQATMV